MEYLNEIAKKWQNKWEEEKIFEANPNNKKKFFLTFPYPYMNGYLHIGHLYTLMRVEAFARYKRMQGYNVLFPQGWHCTGSPIENAAKRIRENEEKQIKIMKDMGFNESEIKKFSDPEYWVKFFPRETEKDYKKIGISIDFRRSFITTSINPYYDKFIRWQFNKLKEKGYVIKGKHPVVWCNKDNSPVGDHSRIEGEGETPQEFILLKFKFNDEYIIAATLRPETVYGQTNLWVGPDIEYVKSKINNEIWIISEECAKKLEEQDKEVENIGKISGKELIGEYCEAPGINKKIIILPSYFCDTKKGTGIVTSVPSDAPDDFMGLEDLKNNKEECEKFNLDFETIKKIKPIPIIDSKDLGDMAAVKICKDMGIKNQHERKKLEQAKKIVYKKGFYEGFMNKNCGKYSGMKVEKAKGLVKEDLLKQKKADLMYELTGKVVCRCLTPSIVKIVSNQWFLKYSDKKWKKLVHKAFKKIKLYPEKSRQQFEYVIDWLTDWACTRELGLGTRLPWDEEWVIESLSDSTIYMAYYTIAHLIKDIHLDKINDKFFDYIFLNKGKIKSVEHLKKEFDYWYPLDFRNSGKDLIQNHLTFFVFNHTAIFPESKWPLTIGVNGWVTVDGEKMSKSLGNMVPIREMAEKFSPDVSRLTILSGGESLDDTNWDSNFAQSMKTKLEQLKDFCIKYHNKGTDEKKEIDKWAESQLNSIVRETTSFMEETLFRSASQKAYFDLQRVIKWYLKRTKPNKKVMNKLIETQLLMLAPFTPFICEEIWESIGKKNFISLEKWPEVDKKKIDKNSEYLEELISNVSSDINNVLKLVKIKPKKIQIFVSENWKYTLFKKFSKEKTKDIGKLIKKLMVKEHAKEISNLIPILVKNPAKIPTAILDQKKELNSLNEAKEFLKKEFNLEFETIKAEDSKEAKSKQALPGKPAILVI